MTLCRCKWGIVSFAPVERGVAVLGLGDKLSRTGAIVEREWDADGSLSVKLRDGGSLLAWAEKAP